MVIMVLSQGVMLRLHISLPIRSLQSTWIVCILTLETKFVHVLFQRIIQISLQNILFNPPLNKVARRKSKKIYLPGNSVSNLHASARVSYLLSGLLSLMNLSIINPKASDLETMTFKTQLVN